jgi:ABC-type transport system involved in multi-copper enzyme maturation permease subunit
MSLTALPIVERELRVAARRRGTFRLRLLLALAAVGVWFTLSVLAPLPGGARGGGVLFQALGGLALAFCLLAGVFLTADCVSEEKRDGTLGLLFLTDLKGYDVALGKLAANSINALYGLLVIMPVLAMPILLGGVTPGEFWRMMLALLVTLQLSLAAGLCVSTCVRETRQAVGITLLLMFLLAIALPALTGLVRSFWKAKTFLYAAWFSPTSLFGSALDGAYHVRGGPVQFWGSLVAVGLLGLAGLALAGTLVTGAWREKGARFVAARARVARRKARAANAGRNSSRNGLLEANPFQWLASRDLVPRWLAHSLLGVAGPLAAALWLGSLSPNVLVRDICMQSLLVTVFLAHQGVKWLIAFEASRQLSEDRHQGSLELLRVTPVSVAQLLAGQWRALRSLFALPLILLALLNVLLIWLWAGVNPLNMPRAIQTIGVEIALGGAATLLVDFYALGWVGMWMALRSNRHSRAIVATLARVILTPWVAIAFLVLMTMGGQFLNAEFITMFALLWFGLGAVIEIAFAVRARADLKRALEENSFQFQELPASTG